MMVILFGILFGVGVIVGALLLHTMIEHHHLSVQPPPLFLIGFHEDGTPIEGWHKEKQND